MRTSWKHKVAFTLLEVLVATAVFSVLSIALFAVFRTATRTQASAYAEADLVQRSRFATDIFKRDVSNVFFRDETSYNVALAQQVQEMEMARIQAETDGNWDTFFAMYGNPNEDRRDQTPSIGNPYERGRIIDLQFAGKNGGDVDSITFSMMAPPGVGRPYRSWGITRVEYRVEGGILLRTESPIETDRRNQLGERITKPSIPDIIAVAEGVKRFDIQYAFWYDYQWYEVDSWDSTNRQIRNGNFTIGDYEKDSRAAAPDSSGFGPGIPGYNESLNNNPNEPLDRLPQYIRLTLELIDSRGNNRSHTYTTLIRVPNSIETYVPNSSFPLEQREEEQSLRDISYNAIMPGVGR